MIKKDNGLSDSLDVVCTLLLDRKLLAWRLHDPNTWCKIPAPNFFILQKIEIFSDSW